MWPTMKLGAVAALVLVPAVLLTAAHGADKGHEASAGGGETPIAQIVLIMSGLREKLTSEFKAEERAFEKFECWYKTVTFSKQMMNSVATSRIDYLDTYIKDIDNNAYEFTSERADLEKQAATIAKDLETASALRNEEYQDYQAAAEEMQQAVAALEGAIAALEAGTVGSFLLRRPGAGLLGLRSSLQKALRLSRGMLSKADVQVLEHAINGDVPEWDWKKLNRKATFKAKYTARSKGIVALLKKMLATFEGNLQEANQTEAATVASYEKLKLAKETMMTKTQSALVSLVEEHGARGLKKAEAREEMSTLQEQVQADEAFLVDVEALWQKKSAEWATRKSMRQEELSAISEAISVLRADEAQDAFGKVYRSQGASLLQLARRRPRAPARRSEGLRPAVGALRALAAESQDARVALLARNVSAESISLVVEMVEQLVTTLQGEEQTDLENKERCEAQRANNTRQARLQSTAIDGMTEEIVRARGRVKELSGQIAEQEEVLANLNHTLEELMAERAEEVRLFEEKKADYLAGEDLIRKAQHLVEEAMEKLKGEEATSSGAFVQLTRTPVPGRPNPAKAVAPQEPPPPRRRQALAQQRLSRQGHTANQSQPFEVQAGEAPPPPPPTWEDPTYTGASSHNKGIVFILSMLAEDLHKDLAREEAAEAEAQAAYEKMKSNLDTGIQAAKDAVSEYEGVKAEAEQEAIDKDTERVAKKAELKAGMEEIAAVAPGCEFLLVHFAERTKKRQIEIDGLLGAKVTLQELDFHA